MTVRAVNIRMQQAIWDGDTDYLNEHAGCICCCDEHTFREGCPAFAWGGCRGQCSMSREDEEAWARHYEKHHGMSREQFFG